MHKLESEAITVETVISGHGNTKGNLEYSSIIVRKYTFLLVLGRGPLKSIFSRLFKRLCCFYQVRFNRFTKPRFTLSTDAAGIIHPPHIFHRIRQISRFYKVVHASNTQMTQWWMKFGEWASIPTNWWTRWPQESTRNCILLPGAVNNVKIKARQLHTPSHDLIILYFALLVLVKHETHRPLVSF